MEQERIKMKYHARYLKSNKTECGKKINLKMLVFERDNFLSFPNQKIRCSHCRNKIYTPFLAKFIKEDDEEIYIEPENNTANTEIKENISIEPQLEKYKNHLLSLKYKLVYYEYMSTFISFLEAQKQDLITQDLITQYIQSKKWRIATTNLFINSGRNFFEFVFGKEVENPFKKFKTRKPDIKIKDFLTKEELDKGISYIIAESSLNATKVQAILYFMFDTGMRKTEVVNMKRENIIFDPEQSYVKIYIAKRNKERVDFITDKTRQYLESYFAMEAEIKNVFNISINQIEHLTNLLKRVFPNKNITPHTLRRSAALNWFKKGLGISDIQLLLGHENIATTAVYLRKNAEQLKETFKDKLNKLK